MWERTLFPFPTLSSFHHSDIAITIAMTIAIVAILLMIFTRQCHALCVQCRCRKSRRPCRSCGNRTANAALQFNIMIMIMITMITMMMMERWWWACANAELWPITLIHLRAQCLVELFSIIGSETMKRQNDCHETWMMMMMSIIYQLFVHNRMRDNKETKWDNHQAW